MREQYPQPWSLSELARVAHMSRHHFDRVFREITHLTPRQFLAAVRLDAAKRLLENTRRSVTEICVDVGYSSLGTFSHLFSSGVGTSPTVYRHLFAPALEGTVVPGDGYPIPLVSVSTGIPRLLDAGGQLVTGLFVPQQQGLPGCSPALGLRCRVDAPESLSGPIFVGVYPEDIPWGWPLVGYILDEPCEFHLPPGFPGHPAILMAMTFRRPRDPSHLCLGDPTQVLVATAVIRPSAGGPLVVKLRSLREIDAPLLYYLPFFGHLLRHCLGPPGPLRSN
jgi:AraC-like DNA-binding protein